MVIPGESSGKDRKIIDRLLQKIEDEDEALANDLG